MFYPKSCVCLGIIYFNCFFLYLFESQAVLMFPLSLYTVTTRPHRVGRRGVARKGEGSGEERFLGRVETSERVIQKHVVGSGNC